MNKEEIIKKRELSEGEWQSFYGHCVAENMTFKRCHAFNNGKCMNGFGNMLCRVEIGTISHPDD